MRQSQDIRAWGHACTEAFIFLHAKILDKNS